MEANSAVERLQEALRSLPGVGPRNAQRMAFHILERDREGGRNIMLALSEALEKVRHCERCHNFSETDLCSICSSKRRDPKQLCVVEGPADLKNIEKAGVYQGMYFVLMGHISPLDGIGPDQIGIPQLAQLLEHEEVTEIILGTNFTTEGEATAAYIFELLDGKDIHLTRLARGLPVGSELEYVDQHTLARAFEDRRQYY